MNLNFNIDYQTSFGEELVLNLVSSGHEGERKINQYRMYTLDGMRWMCSIDNVLHSDGHIDYFYSLMRGEEVLRKEWTLEMHRLELIACKAEHYTVYDHWIDIPENAYLYSSAFTDCINRHDPYLCTYRALESSCTTTPSRRAVGRLGQRTVNGVLGSGQCRANGGAQLQRMDG